MGALEGAETELQKSYRRYRTQAQMGAAERQRGARRGMDRASAPEVVVTVEPISPPSPGHCRVTGRPVRADS